MTTSDPRRPSPGDDLAARVELLKIPYCPLTPTAHQAKFLVDLGSEALYGGAAGGGKSVALLMAALQFVEVPGYAAIIFRPTLAESSQPSGPIAVALEWIGRQAVWDKGKSRWRFKSGATLSFGYLDNEHDKYRYLGGEYQFIGFDELTQFAEDDYRYLFSRRRRPSTDQPLSKVPLRTRSTSNPGGPGHDWVRRTFIEPNRPNQIATLETAPSYYPARIQDNPHLDADNYIASLNRLPPVERERLLNGNWDVRPEGRLFQRSWFPPVAPDLVPDDCGRVRYWDLAATPKTPGSDPDYTAGALVASDANGKYYLCDIARRRASPLEIERFVRATAERDGTDVKIYIEQEPGSAGKSVTDNYRTRVLDGYAVRADRPTGNKIMRAEPVAARAEAGDIHLVHGNWNDAFLDEAEIFPDGAHDDQIDALAGAMNALRSRRDFTFLDGFDPSELTKSSHWRSFG